MAPRKAIVAKPSGGVRKKLGTKPMSSTAAKPSSKKKGISAAKPSSKKKGISAAAKPLSKGKGIAPAKPSRKKTAAAAAEIEVSPGRIEILVKSAHCLDFHWKYPREEWSEDYKHLVCLKVEPTLTIGALKSILKAKSWWIPKENLVLVKEGDCTTALNDDNSTLDSCGIKEHDTLLACMECGEYKVFIYYPTLWDFGVTVQSCFQTVGDVKRGIFKRIDLKPEDQILTSYTDEAPLDDWIPLVALGAVKPYLKEMESELPCLKLFGPVHAPVELRGPGKIRSLKKDAK